MATLKVEVRGLRSEAGHVIAGLYTTKKDWLKPVDIRSAKGDPRGDAATCVFEGLLPGTYAVAVFHDENDNGKMDVNLLRLPKEGFGFTNVDKLGFGQPSFDTASFQLGTDDMTVPAKMIYMLGR